MEDCADNRDGTQQSLTESWLPGDANNLEAHEKSPQSLLFRYVGHAGVYQYPSDRMLLPMGQTMRRRAFYYGMSIYPNSRAGSGGLPHGFSSIGAPWIAVAVPRGQSVFVSAVCVVKFCDYGADACGEAAYPQDR